MSTAAVDEAKIQQCYELTGRWLENSGVPHFSTLHRAWRGLPVSLLTFFLLGAFQMTVLTIPAGPTTLSMVALVLAPPAFLTLAWQFGRLLRWTLRLPERAIGQPSAPTRPQVGGWSRLAAAFVLVAVGVLAFFFADGSVTSSGAEPDTELVGAPVSGALQVLAAFVAVLAALLAALLLWDSELWRSSGFRWWRWWFAAGIVTMTVAMTVGVPFMFVGPPVLVLLLVWKRPAIERGSTPGSARRCLFVPAMPLLVAATGGCLVVDRMAGPNVGYRVVTALAIVGVGFLVDRIVLRSSGAPCMGDTRAPDGMGFQMVGFWATLCLGAYPLYSWWHGTDLLKLAINPTWAALTIAWVYFRARRIVVWAGREILGHLGKLLRSVLWALPPLTAIALLVVLSAEFWQVGAVASGLQLGAIVGALLMVTLAVLGLAALRDTPARNTVDVPSDEFFGRYAWDRILDKKPPPPARQRPAVPAPVQKRIDAARTVYGAYFPVGPAPITVSTLGRRETANAMVAAVAFRLVVLLAVGLVAGLLLYGMSFLLVPPDVALDWVKAMNMCERSDPHVGCGAQSWARVYVAVLVTAAGILLLTVQTVYQEGDSASGHGRGDAAGGLGGRAEHAIREQLAVRRLHLVLQHRLHPPQLPPGPH